MKPKVIIDDKLCEASPEVIAELFANLDNEEQARFFNHVAKVASKWPFGFDLQLQYITEDEGLTLAGRRVMQEIGEYSHWGICCKIEKDHRLKV